jgi:hypothetical protein
MRINDKLDPDPHRSGIGRLDLDQSDKLDQDPHQ